MGQYYKPYIKDADGVERVFNPQNAVFRTVHGIDGELAFDDPRCKWDMKCETSYGYLFSGLKLMEHSWMRNDFVNGVLEYICDHPCQVAWVGDYASYSGDFDGRYTLEVYESVWGEDRLPEGRFDEVPGIHEDGYIVNATKGVYIDLARYRELAEFGASYDEGHTWCAHPLPLLTAIGNGRGGGDYWERNPNSEHVGDWAMDTIYFTEERPTEYAEADYGTVTFKEED